MNTTILLLVAAFIIITGYVIGIAGKWKARKSISDSDYWLTKPWKWLFEAVLLSCSGALVWTSIYLDAMFMFIGSIFIGMVAPFARFKASEFMRWSHMVFAFGGFGLLVLSFGLDFGRWDLTILNVAILLSTYFLTRKNKSVIWNIEIALIYSLFFSLIYVVLNY